PLLRVLLPSEHRSYRVVQYLCLLAIYLQALGACTVLRLPLPLIALTVFTMTDFTSSSPTGQRFERDVSIMARLRAPGECPWDREQTFDSIKPYTLEETYEVLEAIDNRDWKELTGELGDLLLQVLLYAEMAQEQGTFTIDDVLDTLSNKLIHRHPHVFGDTKADDSAQVLKNWEALKAEEKRKSLQTNGEAPPARPALLLESVSTKMPALQEAHKISSKAAHVGFDWPEL